MKNLCFLLILIDASSISPLSAKEVGLEKISCPVEMGSFVAFGYTLKSEKITNEEPCSVKYLPSPDEHWVLIIYSNFNTNYVVWLYDAHLKTEPKLVADHVFGRHMDEKWYCDNVFSLIGEGMGYMQDNLFLAGENIVQIKEEELISYCPDYIPE